MYVSTLVRFVDDNEHGLPQEKLEKVLKTHTGADHCLSPICLPRCLCSLLFCCLVIPVLECFKLK
jgi:hypothetical protein